MERKTETNMLTVEAFAAESGMSVPTIRAWIAKRKIEFHRVGSRAIRIPRSVLTDLLERGRVPPVRPAA